MSQANASAGTKKWKERVDPKVDKNCRCHSTQCRLLRTLDHLGDHLAMELRAVVMDADHRHSVAITSCAEELVLHLIDYEKESAVLLKLSVTGQTIGHLGNAIAAAAGFFDTQGMSVRQKDWRRRLQTERDERVGQYEELLLDEKRLRHDLGNDQKLDRETKYLREVGLWAELHHPNVCKFFGAYHVGEDAGVYHDKGLPVDSMDIFLEDWAGLCAGSTLRPRLRVRAPAFVRETPPLI